MDGPLVDSEQFPRSDIDIYSVRLARNKIVCEFLCCSTVSVGIIACLNSLIEDSFWSRIK